MMIGADECVNHCPGPDVDECVEEGLVMSVGECVAVFDDCVEKSAR
jgi:hypothetical protein